MLAMQLEIQGDCLLFASENGMGKRTKTSEFSPQRRGGKGVKCYKITPKTGDLIAAKAVTDENDIMLITNEGIIIRMAAADINVIGRSTSGVKLIRLEEDVKVAGMAKTYHEDEVEESEDDEETSDNDGGNE